MRERGSERKIQKEAVSVVTPSESQQAYKEQARDRRRAEERTSKIDGELKRRRRGAVQRGGDVQRESYSPRKPGKKRASERDSETVQEYSFNKYKRLVLMMTDWTS